MAKRMKLNAEGFRKIRTSPKVRSDLLKRAKRVAAAAGGEINGFQVTELVLEDNRAAVSVMALGRARGSNKKHHSLLRALDAGRG